jgi:hypothetical protein
MAGVKITDLGTLTTAVDADLLYIVDVSDTSQSPQGTSKQIEVGNMFSSGTYTPTASGFVNGINVNPQSAKFTKVGNIVNCTLQIEIQLDVAETTGSFELSLPIPSTFTNSKELVGMMQYAAMAEIVGLTIGAEITNNTCLVDIEVATPNITMTLTVLTFQYEVL